MCRECDVVTVHAMLRNPSVSDDAILQYVSAAFEVNLRSPCDKTPLMTAAYCGRKELVEPLVAMGAVACATSERTGDTAAHYAMHSLIGHVRQCSTLMALLEVGVDSETTNADGYTALQLAEKYGNLHVINSGNSRSPVRS